MKTFFLLLTLLFSFNYQEDTEEKVKDIVNRRRITEDEISGYTTPGNKENGVTIFYSVKKEKKGYYYSYQILNDSWKPIRQFSLDLHSKNIKSKKIDEDISYKAKTGNFIFVGDQKVYEYKSPSDYTMVSLKVDEKSEEDMERPHNLKVKDNKFVAFFDELMPGKKSNVFGFYSDYPPEFNNVSVFEFVADRLKDEPESIEGKLPVPVEEPVARTGAVQYYNGAVTPESGNYSANIPGSSQLGNAIAPVGMGNNGSGGGLGGGGLIGSNRRQNESDSNKNGSNSNQQVKVIVNNNTINEIDITNCCEKECHITPEPTSFILALFCLPFFYFIKFFTKNSI